MLEVIKEGLFDQISRYNIGKKERIDEWLKEGINKGLKEGKLEIAKNMLKLNIAIIIISEATVLSVEEINKLRD